LTTVRGSNAGFSWPARAPAAAPATNTAPPRTNSRLSIGLFIILSLRNGSALAAHCTPFLPQCPGVPNRPAWSTQLLTGPVLTYFRSPLRRRGTRGPARGPWAAARAPKPFRDKDLPRPDLFRTNLQTLDRVRNNAGTNRGKLQVSSPLPLSLVDLQSATGVPGEVFGHRIAKTPKLGQAAAVALAVSLALPAASSCFWSVGFRFCRIRPCRCEWPATWPGLFGHWEFDSAAFWLLAWRIWLPSNSYLLTPIS